MTPDIFMYKWMHNLCPIWTPSPFMNKFINSIPLFWYKKQTLILLTQLKDVAKIASILCITSYVKMYLLLCFEYLLFEGSVNHIIISPTKCDIVENDDEQNNGGDDLGVFIHMVHYAYIWVSIRRVRLFNGYYSNEVIVFPE